jgi:hypothetical protein
MSDAPHRLSIIVPAVVAEGEPVNVTLDGVPLRGCYGIVLNAGLGQFTTATLTLACSVNVEGQGFTMKAKGH